MHFLTTKGENTISKYVCMDKNVLCILQSTIAAFESNWSATRERKKKFFEQDAVAAVKEFCDFLKQDHNMNVRYFGESMAIVLQTVRG